MSDEVFWFMSGFGFGIMTWGLSSALYDWFVFERHRP